MKPARPGLEGGSEMLPGERTGGADGLAEPITRSVAGLGSDSGSLPNEAEGSSGPSTERRRERALDWVGRWRFWLLFWASSCIFKDIDFWRSHHSELASIMKSFQSCELSLCINLASKFYLPFTLHSFFIYLALFIACEEVAPLRFMLRILGCLLYPVLGQTFLFTWYVYAHLFVALVATFISMSAVESHAFLLSGIFSSVLMLFRMLVLKQRDVPVTSVRSLVLRLCVAKPANAPEAAPTSSSPLA